MNPKRDLCRNFQRGSCQYGERCRYLHVTEQQNKSNPYGFGAQNGNQNQVQNQQQKPNPFGFGVQIGSQTKGASGLGTSQQNNVKPFANTWNRLNSATTATSFPSRQSEAQNQQNNHKCSNPEVCKQIIIEDSKNESPLWKLSCYGHWRELPCDINGDISYEELRAAAYEDARRGLGLQSIVEKERNLHNSKLAEYNNLLGRPYARTSDTVAKNLFRLNDSTGPSSLNQNTVPPSVSSFSQAGALLNMPSNGSAPFAISQNQPSPFSIAASKVGPFGANNSQFKGSGFGNVQNPPRLFGTFDRSIVQTSSVESVSKGNGFLSPPVTAQNLNTSVNNQLAQQPPVMAQNLNTSVNNQLAQPPPVTAQNLNTSVNNQLAQPIEMTKPFTNELVDSLVKQPIQKKVEVKTDPRIWAKAEWKRGEIPEEPPF